MKRQSEEMKRNASPKKKGMGNVKEDLVRLRSKWRKIVTGDEKKRIRDLVLETQNKPENFKLFDKMAFTLGVMNICCCQFFLFNQPSLFWLWYAQVMTAVLWARAIHFKGLGWEYFLFDFCYFAIICSFVSLFVFPEVKILQNIGFIYANGPLAWAIVVWRNSFVFHDFDKITSVYIHLLPSMLSYVHRYYGHTSLLAALSSKLGVPLLPSFTSFVSTSESTFTASQYLTLRDYGVAVLVYLFWQVGYFMKTEVLDRSKLDSNPEKSTSLRYLSGDTKNQMARIVLSLCRSVGIFGRNEGYDAKTFKTKMVFMSSQFLFTLTTFVPTILIYQFQSLHLLFIAYIFAVSVFNGASFYIEVFSSRYQSSIQTRFQSRPREPKAMAVQSQVVASESSVGDQLKAQLKVEVDGEDEGEGSGSDTSVECRSHVESFDSVDCSFDELEIE